MRIAIFGVGAMASLFGVRLSPLADVTLIGHWKEQLTALKQGRMRVIYPDGFEQLIALNASDSIKGLEPVDLAIIAVKSAGTERAARDAAAILKPEGLAVTFQNGIGNLEILQEALGAKRATLGVTAQGAAIESPGVLRYGGQGSTHIATRLEITEQVEALAALFNEAKLPAEIVGDVSSLVWGKLAINCGINPLTAILRVPNGHLPESEWARPLMQEAAIEAAAVAAALGVKFPYADPAARVEEVATLTAANRSSMLSDVLRRVPTEIEVICGAVVRQGMAVGVETPVNGLLYRLVKAVEETYHEAG